MAPLTTTTTTHTLSPAELSYLHTSLTLTPPIRPDARAATTFRPLVAETDVLPGANGSARVCFADGSEAVVGVKAEVVEGIGGGGLDGTVDVSVEIPGVRDDDALPTFLGAMLGEALRVDGRLGTRLGINARFRWRLWVDILLLSQPLSYPLPLLSLTTHLALLSTRLPALLSQGDEDPLFNDDWHASTHLYPRSTTTTSPSSSSSTSFHPPITLLIMTIGPNILFDPSTEELAVADAVLALSLREDSNSNSNPDHPRLHPIALRTIDPPSRLTAPGVSHAAHATAPTTTTTADVLAARETDAGFTTWRPPRGGLDRALVPRILKAVVGAGGVGWEVLEGLRGVEV